MMPYVYRRGLRLQVLGPGSIDLRAKGSGDFGLRLLELSQWQQAKNKNRSWDQRLGLESESRVGHRCRFIFQSNDALNKI